MFKLLFVSALTQELKTVKKQVESLDLKGVKTSFFSCGIGNYETILNLSEYLNKKSDFDFIINVGVCGYGDLKSVKKEKFKSVKEEKFKSVKEEKFKNEGFFQVGRVFNLQNDKELISPCFISFGNLISIACSEKPIFNRRDLKGENFVDMESYGFELVLSKFQIPRIILKVPVDKVGDETKNFDKEKALKFLSEKIDYKKLISSVEKYLNRLPKKEDLSFYFNHFNFTFSEKIIFEKLYFGYKALDSDSFKAFFKENKNLSKKEFLEKIKKKILVLSE